MKRILAISLGLATLLAASAVASAQDPSSLRPAIAARYPAIRWVDGATVARWLRADASERPVLLDARAADEFAVSRLRGARRVDPDLTDVSSLHLSRDAKIVVYCSVGWRSGGIADRLRRAGYEQVYNLQGGIFAWANAGRPVYQGDRRVPRVHPYDAVWGRMLNERYRASL